MAPPHPARWWSTGWSSLVPAWGPSQIGACASCYWNTLAFITTPLPLWWLLCLDPQEVESQALPSRSWEPGGLADICEYLVWRNEASAVCKPLFSVDLRLDFQPSCFSLYISLCTSLLLKGISLFSVSTFFPTATLFIGKWLIPSSGGG